MITGLAITKRRRPRPGHGGGSSQGKNYTLVQTSIVSEWVVNSAGETVKVIKSGAVVAPGSYETTWNNKLEDGSDAGNGNYSIFRKINNVVATWQEVGYNSSIKAGVARASINRGLDFIQDMVIVGTEIFYCNGYAEGDTSMFYSTVANPHLRSKILATNFAGPPRITHVCSDGTNVYWAGDDPYYNGTYSFVMAVNATTKARVNFSSGVVPTITYADNSLYRTIVESKTANSLITGIAVQSSGDYLFVARSGLNLIYVHNKTTGAAVRTIGAVNPKKMHVDANNNLWVVESTNSIKKYTINGDGTLTALFVIAITTPLAVSSQDGLLLTINGDTGQIQSNTLTNGNFGSTFGVLNGYRDSNVASDLKFDWKSVRGYKNTFLAPQADGKLWVCDPGNYRVQRLTADRTSVDNQITYVPRCYKIGLDRGDNKRLFFGFLELEVGYTGEFKNNVTLKSNWGYHVTQADYDEYSMLISPTTLANGRTYCLLPKNGNKSDLKLCELVPNSKLIVHQDTGINNGPELYPDGTLRYVNGRVFGKYTITSFTAGGKPNLSSPVTYATSPDLVHTNNFGHLGETLDNGNVLVFNTDKVAGYHGGALIPSTNKFKYKFAKANSPSYNGAAPTDGTFNIGNGLATGPGGAASAIVSLGSRFFWHQHGEFYNGAGGQMNWFNYYEQDGGLLKVFGAVKSPEGTVLPGMAGNGFSLSGTTENGKDYIYNQDESYYGGIHRWEISGLETIKTDSFTVKITIPVDPVEERGTSFTKAQIKGQVSNYDKGYYKTTNWDRWLANANRLKNNPLMDRYDGVTDSPVKKGSAPVPNTNSNGRYRLILDAARVGTMLEEKQAGTGTVYINAAITALVDQVGRPGVDFSNTAKYVTGVIFDSTPLFEWGQWTVRNIFLPYDLLKKHMSAPQKSAVETWLVNAAMYQIADYHIDHDKYWSDRWTNDVPLTYTVSSYGNAVGVNTVKTSHRVYDGRTGILDRAYKPNNRKGENAVLATMVGCANFSAGNVDSHKAGLTKNQYLRKSGQMFFKEFIDFATYEDGHTAENYRGEDGTKPNQGIHYPALTITQAGWIAYIEAMNGNNTLFEYRSRRLLLVTMIHTKHYDSINGNKKTYRGVAFNGRFGAPENYMTYSYFSHINSYYQSDELWNRIRSENLPGLAPNITAPSGSGANNAFDGPGGWGGMGAYDIYKGIESANRVNIFAQ